MEIFKKIKGYEGLYQISNYGRVYSTKRKKPRFITGMNSFGYKRVRLRDSKGVDTDFFVHRLVALHFIEMIEGKDFVNHKDFDRANNHVDNLEWCTQGENIRHARKHGRIKMTEEGKRRVLEALQKPVIDLQTGIEYDSLSQACRCLNLLHNTQWYKIKRKQKDKRFQFV